MSSKRFISDDVFFIPKRIKRIDDSNTFDLELMFTRYVSLIHNSNDNNIEQVLPTLIYHILQCFGVFVNNVGVKRVSQAMPELATYNRSENDNIIHVIISDPVYESFLLSSSDISVLPNKVYSFGELRTADITSTSPQITIDAPKLCAIAIADHIVQHILNDITMDNDPIYKTQHPHDEFSRVKGTLTSMLECTIVQKAPKHTSSVIL